MPKNKSTKAHRLQFYSPNFVSHVPGNDLGGSNPTQGNPEEEPTSKGQERSSQFSQKFAIKQIEVNTPSQKVIDSGPQPQQGPSPDQCRRHKSQHSQNEKSNLRHTSDLDRVSETSQKSSTSEDSNAALLEDLTAKAAISPATPYRRNGESVPIMAEAEKDSTSVTSSFLSTTELHVTRLPLHTTIDELKDLFPKAKAIKLMLIRDQLNRYKRNAIIEFMNSRHARQSYNQTQYTLFGEVAIKFDFSHVATRHKRDQENPSEASIADLLPKEEIDKDSMVREWIKIQSNYVAHKSKSRMQT